MDEMLFRRRMAMKAWNGRRRGGSQALINVTGVRLATSSFCSDIKKGGTVARDVTYLHLPGFMRVDQIW
jgi:hypothetical protein